MTVDTTEFSFVIRDAESKDIPRIVEIDQNSFSLPWSTASFEFEINRSQISHCWVTEYMGDEEPLIVGTIVVWTIVDEMHIATIAVDAAFRRMGIASALIEKAHQMAREMQLRVVYLEVRRSNLAAQSLYQKFGYQFSGIRKRYYADNHEDAFLMEYQVEAEEASSASR
jgi:ribosomal-protein-alanine N-acetyltransferase